MVARRRLGGRHAELPVHGHRGLCLGRAVGPLRHPHRRALRQVLLGLGLVGASQATALWQFQLIFGVLVGWPPAASTHRWSRWRARWIDKNRSLAVALVSAGMGVAPLTVAQFASWLITDLRLAHRDAGHRHRRVRPADPGVAVWCRRRRSRGTRPRTQSPRAPTIQMTAAEAFRTPQFITLALAISPAAPPFRPDLPHGDLCDGLRHRADGGGQRLRRRRPVRPRRPHAARHAGRSLGAKPVLVGGLLVQALARELYRGRPARRVLRTVGGVRPRLWRRDAALRDPGARVFRRQVMGTVFGAVRPSRASAWRSGPWAGGAVFDPPTATLAPCRFVHHRPCRGRVALAFPTNAARPCSTSAAPRHERAPDPS